MATTDSIVFRAQYHGESILIGKFGDDPITLYTHNYVPLFVHHPSMDADIVLNGQCDLADTQALLDKWRGGAARIACARQQECQ